MGGLRTHTVAVLALALVAPACAANASSSDAKATTTENLVCPELGGNADPLEAHFVDAPGPNARLRTFVASARGLNDVTLEIERRAVETCRAVAQDVGAPEVPRTAALDAQCAPMRNAIADLGKQNIELRVAIAPPKCKVDDARKARCESVAASANAAESGDLCNAQGALYARCSLPSLSFAASKDTENVFRLGKSLESNLPALLYADLALGRRLVDHVSKVVAVSVKLATDLKDVGPHGLACVALATNVVKKSSERLKRFLDLSSEVFLSLDPETVTP
jgi:hypothetical protein